MNTICRNVAAVLALLCVLSAAHDIRAEEKTLDKGMVKVSEAVRAKKYPDALKQLLDIGRSHEPYKALIAAGDKTLKLITEGKTSEAYAAVLTTIKELDKAAQGHDVEGFIRGALRHLRRQLILKLDGDYEKRAGEEPEIKDFEDLEKLAVVPARKALQKKDHFKVVWLCRAGTSFTYRTFRETDTRLQSWHLEIELRLMRFEAQLRAHYPPSWLAAEFDSIRHYFASDETRGKERDRLLKVAQKLFKEAMPLIKDDRSALLGQAALHRTIAFERAAAKDGEGFFQQLGEGAGFGDEAVRTDNNMDDAGRAVLVDYERDLTVFMYSADLQAEEARYLLDQGRQLLQAGDHRAQSFADDLSYTLSAGERALNGIHEIAPDNWQAYLMHAQMVSSEPHYSETDVARMEKKALAWLNKAAETGKEAPEAQWQVAQSFELLNKKHSAATAYRKFAVLAPTDPRAEQAKKKAEQLDPK